VLSQGGNQNAGPSQPEDATTVPTNTQPENPTGNNEKTNNQGTAQNNN
jgi:hypothetical protein